jgi:CRISPR-associated endonuclease/helicase Cas3
MCSATLPVLVGRIGEGTAGFDGLENAVEIFDEDRNALFHSLKRVEFFIPSANEKYDEWESLAAELTPLSRVLCVVNTRKSARDLHKFMPAGTFHLSTLMCGEDRSDVIDAVKKLLRKGQSVRLVSTQLIEAGVDIDFPVVYRAFTGLDSIVQSAGRCNREGGLDGLGRVVVFTPPVSSPRGILSKAEEAARSVLKGRRTFELSDEIFSSYFDDFFRSLNQFDEPRSCQMMFKKTRDLKYQFRTYAKHYHLIDDEEQKPILVPYVNKKNGKNGKKLINQLERRVDYEIVRRLQRYTVNVPEREFQKMDRNRMFRSIGDGKFYTLSDPEDYKPGIGVMLDEDMYSKAMMI